MLVEVVVDFFAVFSLFVGGIGEDEYFYSLTFGEDSTIECLAVPKEKGYLFVCYFLTKVDKLEYYRNKEQWITALYDATYHEKRHIPKEEILVLSHNRKTADEFQESLMCLD